MGDFSLERIELPNRFFQCLCRLELRNAHRRHLHRSASARIARHASRALGASHAHILLRHILPNVVGVVIVYLTLTVPAVILSESFLSYLGLGIQPPQASLGSLIAEGASQINPVRTYWWLIVLPGATLALILLALNFLGDGLRDAFDPRSEGR